MMNDMILWNYWNLWQSPKEADMPGSVAARSDSEWAAYERVMDKVKAEAPASPWARVKAFRIH